MNSECCLDVSAKRYNYGFPYYAKPKIIGEYSTTSAREVIIGKKFLRYLDESLVNKRNCNMDLSKGYNIFQRKDELKNEKLDFILEWISMNAKSATSLKQACGNADIVCWRGLLKKIGSFPYEKEDAFHLSAVKFKSVIFLCDFYTAETIRKKQQASEKEQLMSYWGFKFEQYMTLPSMTGSECKKDTDDPVNNSEQYYIVFKTTLGDLPILSSAEVDCVNSKSEYVEIKTQKKELGDSFWRFKAIKWWIQSFLVGINEIIVGFRDDFGIILDLLRRNGLIYWNSELDVLFGKIFETRRVQTSALVPKDGSWSPDVAFNFLKITLGMIKRRLDLSQELEYYFIDFTPGKERLVLQPLPETVPYRFLPEKFIKEFDKL